MFISDCLSINSSGHLTIGGADTIDLARQYGTPLYVMDENQIRENIRKFKNSIEDCYGGNGMVLYASKAFSCLEMCRIAASEGAGIDVASGGELYTALKAGFPAEHIFFHGNSKSREELEYAVNAEIGCIVVDSTFELEMLNEIAENAGKTVNIMFRLKPGVDAHTHEYIRTGQIDSKFGIAIETGEAFEAAKLARGMKSIALTGIHCHIGSQIFELEPFSAAAEIMLNFISNLKKELQIEICELNLGGGFGIKYLSSDNPKAYGDFMKSTSRTIFEVCESLEIPVPKIFIEPGRSVAGPAGITLYTAGAVKEIPGIRTYLMVDGGMNDNPRYALYHAPYDIVVANRAAEERGSIVTVAGKTCESGDLIQENTPIQAPAPGDIIAVLSTGAYNYAMSMNYNRTPRAAVVFIKDGKSRLAVKRETLEDIVRNDL